MLDHTTLQGFRFHDRKAAGGALAQLLEHLRGERPVVLALAGGGVPVGTPVARALRVPLEVLVVGRLPVPGQPELSMGTVVETGDSHLEGRVIGAAHIGESELARIIAAERARCEQRRELYRDGAPVARVAGRTVILIDDGIVSGSAMRAAIAAVRRLGSRKIVAAAPLAAVETARHLRRLVDQVVAVIEPGHLVSVGAYYRDFHEVGDAEVLALLARAGGVSERSQTVLIPSSSAMIKGELTMPAEPDGLVLCVGDAGGLEPMLPALQQAGLATLVLDPTWLRRGILPGPLGQGDRDKLAERVAATIEWLGEDGSTCRLPLGILAVGPDAESAVRGTRGTPTLVTGDRDDGAAAAQWFAVHLGGMRALRSRH